MPGLAINIAHEDARYASSSTLTPAGDEAKVDQMDKLCSMSTRLSSSRHSSPLRLLSGPHSVDLVASPLASFNISSPTSLLQFPAADDAISPFCSPPILLRVGGPKSPSRETEPVSFFVHEQLLTHASAFFRAALSSRTCGGSRQHRVKHPSAAAYSFLEAQTRTINLPEDRPDDVRSLLRWLYHRFCVGFSPGSSDATPRRQPALKTNKAAVCSTSKLNDCLSRHALHEDDAAAAADDDNDVITRQLHRHRLYRHQRRLLLPAKRHGDISQLLPPRPDPPAFGPLVRLYILADKYRVGLGLKDLLCDVVRELAVEVNAVPNCGDVRLLYENTLGPSPTAGGGGAAPGGGGGCCCQPACMRRLVVDLYVGMRTEKLLASEDGWHVGFLRDVVEGMRRGGMCSRSGLRGGERGSSRATKATKNHGGTTTVAKGDDDDDVAATTGVDGGGGSVDGAAAEEDEDEEELVSVGMLHRRRCDYHDHDL